MQYSESLQERVRSVLFRKASKPFFEELEFEVVVSNSTTKNILDKGVRKMVPEMCAKEKYNSKQTNNKILKGAERKSISHSVNIGVIECL